MAEAFLQAHSFGFLFFPMDAFGLQRVLSAHTTKAKAKAIAAESGGRSGSGRGVHRPLCQYEMHEDGLRGACSLRDSARSSLASACRMSSFT